MLIIVNLIPVAGSVFLDWNLADVMVLYWAESAVIGFFNICKIIVIGRWAALFAAPFFAGHFGGFHGRPFPVYLYDIHRDAAQRRYVRWRSGRGCAAFYQFVACPGRPVYQPRVFFFLNFLGRQEYRGRTVNDQMSEPYSRIIFMHLVLILGGGLTMALGSAVPVLLIMIALKVFFDVKAHLKQHG